MIRHLFGTLLLGCTFGASAQDWQRDIMYHPVTELPHARSLAVDSQGGVHVQAHHYQPETGHAGFAMRFSITPDGFVHWNPGLTALERTPDCGVFAGNGQAMDCFHTDLPGGERVSLEMRSKNGGHIAWSTMLPPELRLLDASIPAEDEALAIFEMPGATGPHASMGVIRFAAHGGQDVLGIEPSCPGGAQLASSKFLMPAASHDAIRAVKLCRHLSGATELRLESFGPGASAWQTLSAFPLPFGLNPTHLDINGKGHGFALVRGPMDDWHLLSTHRDGDQWQPVSFEPIPRDAQVHAVLPGVQNLVLVTDNFDPQDDTIDTTVVIDLQQEAPPRLITYPELRDIRARSFALSNFGDLMILGTLDTSENHTLQPDALWQAREDGSLQWLGDVRIDYGEVPVGTPHLHVTTDHAAVIARMYRNDLHGSSDIGLRIRRIPLPMPLQIPPPL